MNIDVLNKWLSAGASIAVIVGVLAVIGGVLVATQTLKETQKAASATLVLKLRDTLAEDRYAKLTNEIQNNGSAHLLEIDRGGNFHNVEVEEYIGIFDDIGYLVQENVIAREMAYDHFSYDVEKAWCNTDLQQVVRDARKADRNITAASAPMYGNIENLARNYLIKERLSNDLDNQ